MLDAVIISDIHLGAPTSRPKQVLHLLDLIKDNKVRTKRLIINGDLFENLDTSLKRSEWKVLSAIRTISENISVVWVRGNHDCPDPDSIAHITGVELVDEYFFKSGDKKILCVHGDKWDKFMTKHPIITHIADFFYSILLKIDKTHRIARAVKSNSKTFTRCVKQVWKGAIDYAILTESDIVCCGHTHHNCSVNHDGVEYYNSGCWTDKPCSYLTIKDGKVTIQTWIEKC